MYVCMHVCMSVRFLFIGCYGLHAEELALCDHRPVILKTIAPIAGCYLGLGFRVIFWGLREVF